MFLNRKLKEENTRLRYRIAELEERLCPCEGHDWVRVEVTYDYDGHGHSYVKTRLKCKRCGKEMRNFE